MDWQFKVGLGIAVIFGVLPYAVKDMPHWVTWPGLAIGAAIIAWGLIPGSSRIPAGPAWIFIVGIAVCAGAAGWGRDTSAIAGTLKELHRPSLLTLFMTDDAHGFVAEANSKLTLKGNQESWGAIVFLKVVYRLDTGAKFIAFYVPSSKYSYEAIAVLPDTYKKYLDAPVELSTRLTGQSASVKASDMPFSGAINIYHDDFLSPEQIATLNAAFRAHGAKPNFLGADYAENIWSNIQLGKTPPRPDYEVRGDHVLKVGEPDPPIMANGISGAIDTGSTVKFRLPDSFSGNRDL